MDEQHLKRTELLGLMVVRSIKQTQGVTPYQRCKSIVQHKPGPLNLAQELGNATRACNGFLPQPGWIKITPRQPVFMVCHNRADYRLLPTMRIVDHVEITNALKTIPARDGQGLHPGG